MNAESFNPANPVNPVPTDGRVYSGIVVEGEPSDPTRVADIGYSLVRGDYFRTLGIPVRAPPVRRRGEARRSRDGGIE